MIKAEIIADSKNMFGQRITTFIVVFPRIVLAEFNTHRMLSKNSASSRAIPFERMLKMVEENPFVPIRWMKDHKGMQGNDFFDGEICSDAWGHLDRAFNYAEYKEKAAEDFLREKWLEARDEAVTTAKHFAELGLSKQIVNRLLEPFMWHTVIVTGTEWENFFALRAHPAAEIHIQDLANKMLEAYNASEPVALQPGEWHIPFGDKFDHEKLAKVLNVSEDLEKMQSEFQQALVKIATARCARVSYMNFDGSDDYQKDIELHDRLAAAGHWSPFEHCAKAMGTVEMENFGNIRISKDGQHQELHVGWLGNFRGFIQYRKLFEGENKKDPRVIRKATI